MSDWTWTIIAAVVMVIGLCGVVIPLMPGLLVMWLAGLVYGFAVGWSTIGIVVMVLVTLLVAVSYVAGFIVPRKAAAESGASGWAQLGGLVGALAGFFLIPVVGIVVGALAGVLVVEYTRQRSWSEAWTATKGLAKGFGISALIEAGIGFVILLLWAIWAATIVF